jgi:hypothetical protein
MASAFALMVTSPSEILHGASPLHLDTFIEPTVLKAMTPTVARIDILVRHHLAHEHVDLIPCGLASWGAQSGTACCSPLLYGLASATP